MGVKASIDDFGTGYSSLLYLKRLPACELKIDRAFVHELSEAGDGATIVAAIVALAKALNLQIVAEGVENETQQQFLTQLGCHTLQGFLLGKPRTAEEIARDIQTPPIYSQGQYIILTQNNLRLLPPVVHLALIASHCHPGLAFLIHYRLMQAPAYKDHNLWDSLTSSLLFR